MERTIIIDSGSGITKFGFNDNPEFSPLKLPTIIGKAKFPSIMSGMGKKTIYRGNEVYDKQNRGLLDNSFPITNGLINDYEDIEQIWNLVFSQLSIDELSYQNEYPLLLTEPCNSQKASREKMAQIMFETFNVSSLFIGSQALLSFYANSTQQCSGAQSTFTNGNGLVVECGDGHTQIVPIYQGKPIKESSISINYLSGNTITSYIHQSLIDHHLDIETICNIKEKFFGISTEATEGGSFKLPDGKTIDINNNIIENCVDSMFNPTIVLNKLGAGTGCDIGIHQAIYNSILNCKVATNIGNVDESDDDIGGNKQFIENIIISGGNSMFSNFKKRLTNELSTLLPSKSIPNLNIVAQKDRNYSVFKGASMFSSLSTFNSMCVSRQEYNEL